MRIFVAGGAGAIGRQLVPMLLNRGHRVWATTRSTERADWLRAAGAGPVILDVYDADAVNTAIAEARPEVVIHQLTDLARGFSRDDLLRNSRLRQVGTANLVTAAGLAGVRRLVAASAAWLYAPGPEPHGEDDAFRPDTGDDPVLPGVLELERLVLAGNGPEGVVLRYGFFYGPGTVSDGPGSPPTVHVAAAARAAVLAAEGGPSGVYNVVDDGQGVSNQRARELLGWDPAPVASAGPAAATELGETSSSPT